MPDLKDGETAEMQGSASRPYVLKNVGGVYSCSCPAWRNQSLSIDRRTCKHLRKLRGDAAEEARVGAALPTRPTAKEKSPAPPLLLAESWDGAADPTGWWVSEKLDGVRAYWDGRQFLSRQGNRYHAPEWFVEGLPNIPLDGELWMDRKRFQRTVSIVRRGDQTDLWKELRFFVFDAPAAPGGFEERLAYLDAEFRSRQTEYAFRLDQTRCTSREHLRSKLAFINTIGGEGLMLRQPGSQYEAGRSATLLKVKTFHDTEAVVVGHEPGAGKHRGRLGALAAMLPNGIRFNVGTGFSDRQREVPPPIGSTITFHYQELTDAGVPRFPSFAGVRFDAHALSPTQTPTSTPSLFPLKESNMVKTMTKPAPVSSNGAAADVAGPRRFEFVEGTSSKFWEVYAQGTELVVRYGRIGADGSSLTRFFNDPGAALKQMDKLIREKIVKGYREVK